MPSKKKLYEAGEYYRQQWKQCYDDSAATANAATARIEHLENVVEAQKEHIVNAERRLREEEDKCATWRKATTYLITSMETEADVAHDASRAMLSKVQHAHKILGNLLRSSASPAPDQS